MAFDPYQPYGPVVTTTMRVVTWNVWGRYGDHEGREAGIEDALVEAGPDVVCLVESWALDSDRQVDRIGERLHLGHSCFVGERDEGGWTSGIGVVSRWPIVDQQRRPLQDDDDGGSVGEAVFVALAGPRGIVQLFVAMLDYPLYASAVRQAQVRRLGAFIAEVARRRHITVVCGDFNAGPDSDEIGMLTGRRETVEPGLVFYDAWEMAGDGTAGHTWSNENRLAALAMYPNRRFDYILSAWPRAGGLGHPTHCELLGRSAAGGADLSDHYGVVADLRY
jgi:endonuclease/exonuclease/phosphatase family metal-dependent hydrolase